jgi:hypothetical protein
MFLTGLIQHLVKTPQTRLGHRTISASPPGKAAFSDAPTDCCGCLGPYELKQEEGDPITIEIRVTAVPRQNYGRPQNQQLTTIFPIVDLI